MTQPPDASPDPRIGLAQYRTALAKFRAQLALDRTTLAWIRTALSMATFGFGVVGFFRAVRQATPGVEAIHLYQDAIHLGTALIVIGLVATLLAGVSHLASLRRLGRRGEAGTRPTFTGGRSDAQNDRFTLVHVFPVSIEPATVPRDLT